MNRSPVQCRILHAPIIVTIAVVAGLAQERPKLGQRPAQLSWTEARPVVEALGNEVPAELRSAQASAGAWWRWVRRRDWEIRGRLRGGVEDALANFLLFGSSFTNEPRVTRSQLGTLLRNDDPEAAALIRRRATDLARALKSSDWDERIFFFREVIPKDEQIKPYLMANVARAVKEQIAFAQALHQARSIGDSTKEFAARSRLYSARGLAPDTSLLANYGVEQALKAMRDRALLAARSVRNVAVIGPGLDFIDKQEGYDFYPPQTIQPFAVIDSLLRLALAADGGPAVTAIDINSRVIGHIERAVELARKNKRGYAIQLPRDARATWKPDLVRYWREFGGEIASPVEPLRPPDELGELDLRAVRVWPEVVQRIKPVQMNVVLERLTPTADARFDLIIATNVFLYYTVFEQALALAGIQRILRPGGWLLTNNALPEVSGAKVRSVDYLTVVYSDRRDDGDHIAWYRLTED